jgi:hypothetical protein
MKITPTSKIVQFAVALTTENYENLYALCEDGSLWALYSRHEWQCLVPAPQAPGVHFIPAGVANRLQASADADETQRPSIIPFCP